MIETMIVLNNYFHDLAVSLVFVTSVAMFLLARYAGGGTAESKGLSLFVISRLSAVFWGSVLYVIAGGVSRIWNMDEFEWADAVRNGQTLALMVKHAILLVLFAYGIYLRAGVHGKVSAMRKEIL